jgi:hypothetical protein
MRIKGLIVCVQLRLVLDSFNMVFKVIEFSLLLRVGVKICQGREATLRLTDVWTFSLPQRSDYNWR